MDPHAISLTHREYVSAFTDKYFPYSDFNFTSMWAWDIEQKIRIFEISNNLVVRFNDYLTGEPFYSFLGDTDPNGTTDYLLKLSADEGLEPKLKMVPACSIKNLDTDNFLVTEDLNHFDYVYDLKEVTDAVGKKFARHRQCINSFDRMYASQNPSAVEAHTLTLKEMRRDIAIVNEQWKANKIQRTGEAWDTDSDRDAQALERMLEDTHNRLFTTCLFYKNQPIGYTVNELLNNEYAIGHFTKADTRYGGVIQFLMKKTFESMLLAGKKLLNGQQDLGVEGLRFSKQSFRPNHYIKKYSVERR